MTDIVDRLRAGESRRSFLADLPPDEPPMAIERSIPPPAICIEAAQEIETLRDEGERLRLTIENLRVRLWQAEGMPGGGA